METNHSIEATISITVTPVEKPNAAGAALKP
jgi:hypothetical protein